MLNNKGMSLVEVIISIALISVVLVFMIKLLIDVNNTQTNNDYAKDNQVVRTEILRAIHNDLNSKTLRSIDDSSSTSNTLSIRFQFTDNSSSQITATETGLTYRSSTNNTRRWQFVDCTLDYTHADVYLSKEKNIYTLTIDIAIYTINERNDQNNNNTLDDIMISYIGNSSDFTTSALECLGNIC